MLCCVCVGVSSEKAGMEGGAGMGEPSFDAKLWKVDVTSSGLDVS